MQYKILTRLLFTTLAISALVSCSSTKKNGDIYKVKAFNLTDELQLRSSDRAIPFEHEYIMHGAVTKDERDERNGHYYSVMWSPRYPGQSAQLKFEYTQANTGSKILSKTINIAKAKRRNVTKLEITGDEFHSQGKVTTWRVSLLQNGEVIDEDASFLWKDVTRPF